MNSISDKKHYIDAFVGKIIRNRRKELNYKLKDLADAIGLTQQQVQKYEKGHNRISASKLFEVATTLKKDISYFFPSNMDYNLELESQKMTLSDSQKEEYNANEKKNILRLLRAFKEIENEVLQEQILSLVETLAKVHNSVNDNK